MDLVLPPYWYVVLYMEGMTMETCSLLIMVKLALSLEGKNFTVHDKPCYFFSLKKKNNLYCSIQIYMNNKVQLPFRIRLFTWGFSPLSNCRRLLRSSKSTNVKLMTPLNFYMLRRANVCLFSAKTNPFQGFIWMMRNFHL